MYPTRHLYIPKRGRGQARRGRGWGNVRGCGVHGGRAATNKTPDPPALIWYGPQGFTELSLVGSLGLPWAHTALRMDAVYDNLVAFWEQPFLRHIGEWHPKGSAKWYWDITECSRDEGIPWSPLSTRWFDAGLLPSGLSSGYSAFGRPFGSQRSNFMP